MEALCVKHRAEVATFDVNNVQQAEGRSAAVESLILSRNCELQAFSSVKQKEYCRGLCPINIAPTMLNMTARPVDVRVDPNWG